MKNNNVPLVSIIVPCYNVEQYLGRCISSLTGQTLIDIEIVLVDDGSPDRVPQMCEEWQLKDERVKVVHKGNSGLGFARNSGIEIARGEYVAFVDGDDYVDSRMYDTLYREAKRSNADAVFCGFKFEEKNGIWTEKNEVESRTEFNTREEIDGFMLDMIASAPGEKIERRYWMSVWHAIYKREILEKYSVRFPSEREVVSEDIPFQCVFLQKSLKIVYIPDVLYCYCLNNSSLTKSFNIDKFYRFKDLHRILSEITQNVSGSLLRIDRLYIGYVRSLIKQMFEMKIQERDNYLKEIMNDIIWIVLKKRYYPSYLPLYPRLVYCLILYRKGKLLKFLMNSIDLIKFYKE